MPLVKLLYDLITLKAVSFISDCLFTAALSFTAALCSLYKAQSLLPVCTICLYVFQMVLMLDKTPWTSTVH